MKYADAGVDIDKAERAMISIKSAVKSTFTPQVLADFGNFGGLFSIADLKMKSPVLVSSIDGVGTKVKIAIDMEKFEYPGHDIVNHCVDDILVQGARPLFFMDYFATGLLDERALTSVVKGLAAACRANGCALLGGETAEMPGFYKTGDFDLAGAIVGVVDKNKLIDGSRIHPGDAVLGLGSSGLHTNGYSLARRVLLDKSGYRLSDRPEGLTESVGEAMVKPHKSYLNSLLPLIDEGLIHGLAHITGGGFTGNIPRILPAGMEVAINRKSWEPPPIFRMIQEKGKVEQDEMYRTFNMGVGMVAMVAPTMENRVKSRLELAGETVFSIGKTQESKGKPRVIYTENSS